MGKYLNEIELSRDSLRGDKIKGEGVLSFKIMNNFLNNFYQFTCLTLLLA